MDKKWWQCTYYFIKKRDPYQLRSLLTKNKERPFWNFERIMNIERSHGVRSTFFFLNETKKLEPLKLSSYPLALGYYRIDEPRITELIRTLDAGGWEIAVHGSYDSYLSKDLLKREKADLEELLGKPVLGIRQHFLNLDPLTTWQLQKEVGFRYDASFGLRRGVGNREGRDFPFYPIDGDLLEIPLTIMDCPLFSISKDKEHAWQRCLGLMDGAEERGSLLTVLWHNNKFNDNECPGMAEIYERIIEECQRRDAWVATAGEIHAWWTRERPSPSEKSWVNINSEPVNVARYRTEHGGAKDAMPEIGALRSHPPF